MIKKILAAVFEFLGLFLLIGFVLTCNIVLFLNILQRETSIVYSEDSIKFAALFTFYNTIFITLIVFIVDVIRRKFFVDKPVSKILEVTNRITHGDFKARVQPFGFGVFNKIGTNLNIMADELSSTETLRADFISNVSHELRTPLSVLQNYGSLLEEPNLPEEKRLEYAKSINRVTRHLSELVTNILKLNKLEAQKISPSLEKCNVSDALCECLLDFESEWENKNIEIDTDIEEGVYINSDPDMLTIIWANLFSNAVKFTPVGGKISVTLKKSSYYVTVSVSDTGCGMDENTMKHIFDKFYQGDTSHAQQGNGLGLALVKRVIDILGGKITVESTPGAGSTFTVKLRVN